MSLAESHWRLPSWTEISLGAALFVAFAAISLVLTGWILIKLPPDYFVGPVAPAFWSNRGAAARLFGRVLRNLIGVVLVILGIILSLPGVPGQGLLTILIGLMCLDLPGKRRLEQWMISRPRIFNAVNRLRAHYGKPALEVDMTGPPSHRDIRAPDANP